ncbi:hypothetical protein GC093_25335 [Paenibacillus sp. LMG 31456]|uniref:Guanylate cyclase domain-containing protein n=1 Tax=Paenibacillus foliorum TaxID=2654974 RepID=A0A972K292_9BACL|nr:hypothetical protein [Paenibacillus foliorum]
MSQYVFIRGARTWATGRVVNSNHILDYFGRTVNLASRTQGLSVGHDIIVSKECSERFGVKALLEKYPCKVELFEQTLKGIEGVIQLARIGVIESAENPVKVGVRHRKRLHLQPHTNLNNI